MSKFFRAVGVVFSLFVAGIILAFLVPKIAFWAGLAFLLVPAFAVFKPLPKIHLKHRAFSASLAVFVGFMTISASMGKMAESDKLSDLRESDPAAYLAQIESKDKALWLEELELLDPERHAQESAKTAEVEAEKARQEAARSAQEAQQKKAAAERKAADDARNKAEINEIKYQRVARELVSGVLKDPGSAQFRNQRAFCGEVNSKNSFGGYSGFKRFIAAGRDLVIIEGDPALARGAFQEAWNQACK